MGRREEKIWHHHKIRAEACWEVYVKNIEIMQEHFERCLILYHPGENQRLYSSWRTSRFIYSFSSALGSFSFYITQLLKNNRNISDIKSVAVALTPLPSNSWLLVLMQMQNLKHSVCHKQRKELLKTKHRRFSNPFTSCFGTEPALFQSLLPIPKK